MRFFASPFVAWCLVWLLPQADAIEFDTQIVPLLTKSGCNGGACHGAAAGRGGFHLSLLGANPIADYEAMVHAFEGRRVNRVSAEASLIFAKPTGELEHGGDVVLSPDSPAAQQLLDWIREGARRHEPSRLVRCVITPQRRVCPPKLPVQIPLKVYAEFESGERNDVTSLTAFSTSDSASIDVDEDGMVTVHRPGQHTLIARYMDRVLPVQFLAPYADEAIDLHEPRVNFIDDNILDVLSEMRLPVSPMASDSEWLRRVTLDLTGRLPNPIEAASFIDDPHREKRQHAVERLLSSQAFVDYWTLRLARWLGLHSLPNDREGVACYAQWIRHTIEVDMGMDAMAHSLLVATGDSHVVGPANFGRMVPDARKHAELAGRFFLGVRLGCANCHNHPLDRWTQDDYHGLAAIFARLERGREVRFAARGGVTNLRTNEPAIPRIPGVRDLTELANPQVELADWLVDDANRFFAKAMVNRLWQSMLGRGLVEPTDDMRETNPPTHPELLDGLAEDFKAHGYQIRHTLRTIALSQTYARSSVVLEGNALDDRFYSRAYSKRLMPEVLADAIADVTNIVAPNQLTSSGSRAVHIVDPLEPSASLDVLGRCSRAEGCDASLATNLGVATQLHLMNGDLINQKLRDAQGFLRQSLLQGNSNQEIIIDFYLRGLSRRPSPEELTLWLSQIRDTDARGRSELLEDFAWSLLMSRSFSENH